MQTRLNGERGTAAKKGLIRRTILHELHHSAFIVSICFSVKQNHTTNAAEKFDKTSRSNSRILLKP